MDVTAELDALADRIYRLRMAHGWTQEDLAAVVGTDARCVSVWECRHIRPSLPIVYRLAAAFGVSVGDLLDSAGSR